MYLPFGLKPPELRHYVLSCDHISRDRVDGRYLTKHKHGSSPPLMKYELQMDYT